MRDGIVPVMEVNGNNGNNGFGGFGGDYGAWWILIIIILFGGYGRGFGGFGGGYGNTGSTSVYEGYVLNNDFSQLSKQISDTYNMTDRKFDAITNGLCSGFYQEAQLINQTNSNIANAQYNLTNAITTNGYETRNAITQDTIANMQNTNLLQGSLKDCCCKLEAQLADSKYEMAKGFCSTNNTIAMSTRDIVDNMNANYRALHDEIVANRIEDKNNQIAMLQTQLNNAELRASQENQTREIVNTIRPCPIPAYQSCNPWGCNCNQGCGCGM